MTVGSEARRIHSVLSVGDDRESRDGEGTMERYVLGGGDVR